MAIFSKETNGSSEAKNTAPPGEGSLSIIAAGMKVTGDIDTDGVVKIEGKVEGSIRAGRQVLIGRAGEVQGDITTREAVIGGKVQGSIVAAERLEVQGTSMIVGDINTKSIAVVEGGRINGSVKISDTADALGRSGGKSPTPQPVAVVR
jgi:cytoskeletal protein CcmA (bactofilin family)